MYRYGHPESFNPAVITNKEVHMIYRNMNNETGSSQAAGFHKKQDENFCLVSLLCWSNGRARLKH